MATRVLFSAEDFERLLVNNDRRLELIRGEVYELGGVTPRHSEVAGEIYARISDWNKRAKAGRVGVEGGFTIERQPDTVRAPDVHFVAKGRITPEQARKGFPQLAPDLIVEVRSPNDAWSDLGDKAEQFFVPARGWPYSSSPTISSKFAGRSGRRGGSKRTTS